MAESNRMARKAAKTESDLETRAKTNEPSIGIQMKPLGYFKHLFCYVTLGILSCYMFHIYEIQFLHLIVLKHFSDRIVMRMVLYFDHFIPCADISVNRGVFCCEIYFDYSNCAFIYTPKSQTFSRICGKPL